MLTTRLDPHIFLIDLKPAGLSHFIASYVVKAEKVAIVETGPVVTIPNLLAGLKEIKVDVEDVDYIAVSHIHLDHGGGAGALLKHLPKAKLIVHKRGAPHLANPEELWVQSRQVLGKVAEFYDEPVPVANERIIIPEDGETFSLGESVELKVIETLGHASHHLVFHEAISRGIFSGDAAGIYLDKFDVVVPTTPTPFRLDISIKSLRKLVNLKSKFLYYSHFGKVHNSTEKLRAYAKQLKLWAEIARQGIEGGENLETIGRKIVEGDAALQKAEGYIRNHEVLRMTVLVESVEGVVKYVEKFGSSLDNLL